MTKDNHSSRRINRLARGLRAANYIEIGVSSGETFHSVEIADRTAVDPHFQFAVAEFANPSTKFFEGTSDAYFAQLDDHKTFDQYFIDGMHTFEQTLRDFSNAVLHSHSRTAWLIDDTKPDDVFSSFKDHRDTMRFRAAAGAQGHSWHGDVYKLVFYIHDFFPSLDYRTIVGSGNPQTLVWRSKREPRTPLFNNLERISRLTYFDLLKHENVLRETEEEEAINLCLVDRQWNSST